LGRRGSIAPHQMNIICHRTLCCSAILAIWFAAIQADADFYNDGYTDHPDVLTRIVAAAQSSDRFKSYEKDGIVLYLSSAKYVGPLKASFGTIHVAYLFYIRSSLQGAKDPAHGHSYLVFLDQDFKIRAYWPASLPNEDISVRDNGLWEGNDLIFDYSNLPSHNSVIFDGQPREIPKWNKS